jgi:dTDP-4-dehydrorhamnose reductase
MRIVVTGSNGQLGRALGQVLAQDDLMLVDLPQHDIIEIHRIVPAVKAFRPELVIHAAAITDVDGCERDADLAYRVNVLGTRNLAVAAQGARCPLVYISTDYVFDGTRHEPYREFDTVNPLNVYARTKWLGETVVRDLMTAYYIVRVAWLYGAGPRNFVRTVLRLADQCGPLRIVTDEVGSPTCAVDVARALERLVAVPAYGTYHLPNAGTCSRYEWAEEILRLAGRADVELVPTANYQRAARVPKEVALRNQCGAEIGITMRPWRDALGEYMRESGNAAN